MENRPHSPPVDDFNDAVEFERYQQRLEGEEVPEQSFDQFDGEWLLRSSVLGGDTAAFRTFRSQGIIISPISKQNSRAQILDIIRQITLLLQLRLDWHNLPQDWLASGNAIFNSYHCTGHLNIKQKLLFSEIFQQA